NLDASQLGIEGATAIGKALANGAPLKTLSLSYNPQTFSKKEAVLALAAGLAVNSSLTALYLSHNQISDEGATTIASLLTSPSSKLRVLDLSFNLIASAGGKALAEMTRSNPALRSLILNNTRIEGEGAKALADAVFIPGC